MGSNDVVAEDDDEDDDFLRVLEYIEPQPFVAEVDIHNKEDEKRIGRDDCRNKDSAAAGLLSSQISNFMDKCNFDDVNVDDIEKIVTTDFVEKLDVDDIDNFVTYPIDLPSSVNPPKTTTSTTSGPAFDSLPDIDVDVGDDDSFLLDSKQLSSVFDFNKDLRVNDASSSDGSDSDGGGSPVRNDDQWENNDDDLEDLARRQEFQSMLSELEDPKKVFRESFSPPLDRSGEHDDANMEGLYKELANMKLTDEDRVGRLMDPNYHPFQDVLHSVEDDDQDNHHHADDDATANNQSRPCTPKVDDADADTDNDDNQDDRHRQDTNSQMSNADDVGEGDDKVPSPLPITPTKEENLLSRISNNTIINDVVDNINANDDIGNEDFAASQTSPNFRPYVTL